MTFETYITQIISDILSQEGSSLVDRLQKELISQDKVATGTLVNSINFSVEGRELTINLQEYAEWVDEGRSPGSFPPPNDILQWVKQKGLQPRGMSGTLEQQQRSLAYVIGRSIERDGIPATNFIDKSVTPQVIQELQNKIVTNIEEGIEEWVLGNIT